MIVYKSLDIMDFFCNFFCKIWFHYSPRPTEVSKHGEIPGLLPREWRSNTSWAAGGFNQTHIEWNWDVRLGDAGDKRIYKIIQIQNIYQVIMKETPLWNPMWPVAIYFQWYYAHGKIFEVEKRSSATRGIEQRTGDDRLTLITVFI